MHEPFDPNEAADLLSSTTGLSCGNHVNGCCAEGFDGQT